MQPIKENITVLPPDNPNKRKSGWVIYESVEGDPEEEKFECKCPKCLEKLRLHKEAWAEGKGHIRVIEGHEAVFMRPDLYSKEEILERSEKDPEDFPPEVLEKIWELKSNEDEE